MKFKYGLTKHQYILTSLYIFSVSTSTLFALTIVPSLSLFRRERQEAESRQTLRAEKQKILQVAPASRDQLSSAFETHAPQRVVTNFTQGSSRAPPQQQGLQMANGLMRDFVYTQRGKLSRLLLLLLYSRGAQTKSRWCAWESKDISFAASAHGIVAQIANQQTTLPEIYCKMRCAIMQKRAHNLSFMPRILVCWVSWDEISI